MSTRNMKLDDIQARAKAAAEKTEQRKRDALLAWQAVEDQSAQLRQKTERLRAQRLAREAADAEAKAAEPPPPVKKTTRKAASRAGG